MRRSLVLIFMLLALLLAACGTPVARPASSASASPTAEATAAATPSAAAGFPVTIEHKYGSTEITQRPERIVTVGLVEQDALLALGIVPVGTTEWFGEQPGAIWPWARDKLDSSEPELVGDASAINFERIAALKPDLILALYSGITKENYDLLAQIAPTIAQPAAYVDYGIPWQELTRIVGQAVGQSEAADTLVKNVEARFAEVRARHPEFVGASAVVATPYEGIWVYGSQDSRGRLLDALGFKLPEEIDAITGEEFGGNISMERVDLLDVDVIIWLDATETEGPLGGPLYEKLKVHTEGREVFLDSYNDPLGAATSIVTVLSIPFLLDGLVPKLAAAIDGGPDTAVESEAPEGSPSPLAEASPEANQTNRGTRTIEHALGTTEVPTNPQRIVCLEHEFTDTLLALGHKPIGSARDLTEIPALANVDTDGIAMVGDWPEVNIETILTLKPDLIIMAAWRLDYQDEQLYETLSRIAPTVVIPDARDWKVDLQNLAHVINADVEAERWMADYNERVTALRQQVAGTTVSIVRPQEDAVLLYGPTSNPGRVLTDLGFKVQEVPRELIDWGEDGTWSIGQMSFEWVPNIDSEHIFMISYDIPDDTTAEELTRQPIWQTVPAVQAGNVHAIHGQAWTNHGAHGVLTMIDEVEAALVSAQE